jgi:DUF917 family protein
MEFTLTIQLGNAAMQTGEDVAEALARVADSLQGGVQSGTIRDVNGNTVGSWDLPELPPEYTEE